MNKETWEFCEIEAFYSRYRPLTPYGKLDKDKRVFMTGEAALEAEYDLTERLRAFIRKNEFAAKKLESHLKEIPFLDMKLSGGLAASELFLVKKFLRNARAAFALLPPGIRRAFGIEWRSDGLLELLCRGGGDCDTFYLADSYSPALARARARVAGADAALAALNKSKNAHWRRTRGLDFSGNDFLVVPEGGKYPPEEFFAEPYDAKHLLLRPVYGPEFLRLSAERDRLLAAERAEESRVLAALSRAVAAEKERISGYVNFLTRVDVLLARAALSLDLKLVRPELRPYGSAIEIEAGRFLPLEEQLKGAGLDYTPLSCRLRERVAVVHGSNMGGKTVVLKTAGFLQILAQSGFFVPAKAFRTVAFEAAHYVGEGGCGRVEGLSGFGLELFQFMQAYSGRRERALFLVDEFARTTNSAEASALLSAVVAEFGASARTYALVSTHFYGIEGGRGVAFYRMKGFDAAGFGRHGGTLNARLGMINRFMRYELLPGDGKTKIYDALAIAGLLGVDAGIIAAARRGLENIDEN